MRNNLDILLSDGIIDEVLGLLQSGKEAEVYRVTYRGRVVAAKVYKDRQQRSFKHNASYKEGRKVRNSRTQRAMDKGSRFGRDEAEDAWKSSEATTLHLLHGHGVRVPTPVMFYEGVLLMELVTDPDGDVAPRLIDAPITREDAGALYRDLRSQIIGVLCCDLIHGDLSPYNVLLGAAGPTIIDFPQTISAAHNTQSEMFFRRDLDNVLGFFAGLDRSLNAHRGDARAIWQAYARRELGPDFVPAVRQFEDERRPAPHQRGGRPQGPEAWSQQREGARPPQQVQQFPPAQQFQGQDRQVNPREAAYAPPQAPPPQQHQGRNFHPREAGQPQQQPREGQGRGYNPPREPAYPQQQQPREGQGRGGYNPPREPAYPQQHQQQPQRQGRGGYNPPREADYPQQPQQPQGQGRSFNPRDTGRPQEPRRERPAQDRPNARPPQQAARGPVEVYVKRTGTRESTSHVESAPARPPQSQHTQQPDRPQAPRGDGDVNGRRGRRR